MSLIPSEVPQKPYDTRAIHLANSAELMQDHPSPAASILLPWLTLAAIVGTFAINIWSNLAPPGGQTIGEISNTQFAEVQITPANYAFVIWGVIYLGLLAFGYYQLLPAQRLDARLRQARPWLILACIAQAIWVACFLSGQFWLSVLAMLTILVSLIWVYRHLEAGRAISRREGWFMQVPMSIYLGWISVATIVNIAAALYSQGWNGWGISAQNWTVALIWIAAALAVWVNLQREDKAFPLVISWALLAVAVRHLSNPTIAIPAVIWAASLAGFALRRGVKASR